MRFRLHIHSTTRHELGWYPFIEAPGAALVYPGSHYRQGRCHPCGLRFVWRGAPRVHDADCPVCSRPLRQTVHFVGVPTIHALGKRRRP